MEKWVVNILDGDFTKTHVSDGNSRSLTFAMANIQICETQAPFPSPVRASQTGASSFRSHAPFACRQIRASHRPPSRLLELQMASARGKSEHEDPHPRSKSKLWARRSCRRRLCSPGVCVGARGSGRCAPRRLTCFCRWRLVSVLRGDFPFPGPPHPLFRA